jgi:hypothetical protein
MCSVKGMPIFEKRRADKETGNVGDVAKYQERKAAVFYVGLRTVQVMQ